MHLPEPVCSRVRCQRGARLPQLDVGSVAGNKGVGQASQLDDLLALCCV